MPSRPGVGTPADGVDEADETRPPWWRKPRRGGARQPLTREAIVDAAVRILDAEGADALTVRRLGQELSTGPATLYWHITGKNELCELVYDRIMGEVVLPEPDPSRWEEQIKDVARQGYRVMLAHNDAVRLSLGRVPVGPSMLRMIEWMLTVLRGAGVPDLMAAYFGDILGRYLDGSVLDVTSMPLGQSDEEDGAENAFRQMHQYFSGLPADRFPNIVALADKMISGDIAERFEFGLDVLVRGLAAYIVKDARTD